MVKDSVLRILEENRGSLISGGSLGRMIGVSRTAIWKAITSLKEEGFNIEIHKSAGYRLQSNCDKISACGIRRYLETSHIGNEFMLFDSLPSTNSYLRKLAEEGAPSCQVIISESQTEGRGRMSRSFFSPSSGIYMSILVRPKDVTIIPQLMTISAAVAVSEAIDEVCGVQSSIKWVNDVYIDGKKICGILTEGSIEAESGSFFYLISGIGINVHTPPGGFPDEIRDTAGAIDQYATKHFTKNQLIAEVLNRMESICVGLINKENQISLIKRYKSRLFMLKQDITVISAGGSYPAHAVNINRHGNLVVKKQDGSFTTLISGEISIRPN